MSTPASIKDEERSKPLSPTEDAAAHLNLPNLSLLAKGFRTDFSISFIVSNPDKKLLLSTTKSFSILLFAIISFASFVFIGSFTIAKFSLVIISPTLTLLSSKNRISLLVKIPSTLFALSTTGKPVMLYFFAIFFAVLTVSSKFKVIGL